MDTMNMPKSHGTRAFGVPPGTPSQHAFIMLGKKTLFLVHMTMFHMEEHMYQMVLRSSLPDDAMKKYVEDRREHPDDAYFLGNVPTELFTVPRVASGRLETFEADIWRGIPFKKHYDEWPWNGVPPFISRVPVAIDRVVYFRHFDFNLNYPKSLTYILFGADGEAHMNHYQVKEPDFDQVVSLKSAPDWIPVEDLEAGIDVDFPEMRKTPPVYCTNPIPPGTYTVECAGQATNTGKIEVGNSWWCSTKVVNMDDPCPEAATT